MKSAGVTAKTAPGTAQRQPVVLLIGNPNAGKTTLFNALTGLNQKVGNYPGVTVERKEGIAYTQHGKPLRVVDLPGAYSLSVRSPDEALMLDVLFGREPLIGRPDAIVCVIDASNLERNLYLATQVVELGLPCVIVLSMIDVALRRGIRIDEQKLSQRLQVPVIQGNLEKGECIVPLKLALSRSLEARRDLGVELPGAIQKAVDELMPVLRSAGRDDTMARAEALQLISSEPDWLRARPEATRVKLLQQRLDRDCPGWRSELITSRYAWIGGLVRDTVRRFNPGKITMTERVDGVVLHPLWGAPILVLIMGILFWSIFRLAVPFMDAIDAGFGWAGQFVKSSLPTGPLADLLADGVVAGVGGVVIFLPQILLLFFFIALLESTGYMARAAFILDRLMSRVGLHGRAFIPLLSSYACAIPGIMATRTIESPKDRLVTILVAPFMSCSARLPVYLIMIAALLPDAENSALARTGILLMLYLAGTAMAFAIAWLLKKTLMRGPQQSMVLELPPYRVPSVKRVFREMLERAWVFVRRAGSIILALSVVLWFLFNFPRLEDGQGPVPIEQSYAGQIGSVAEPVFAPIGYDWRITVGVIASFAAREVFVSTLAIVYHTDEESGDEPLLDALSASKRADGSPLFTPLTTLSVMVFFVFALQCMSTVAVVKRETNSWFWPMFQLVFMFGVAWGMAFVVYQGGQLIGFQ